MPFPAKEYITSLGWGALPSVPPVFSGMLRYLMCDPSTEQMFQCYPSDSNDRFFVASIIRSKVWNSTKIGPAKLVGRFTPVGGMGVWDAIRSLFGDGNSSHEWYSRYDPLVWTDNPWCNQQGRREWASGSIRENYDDGGGVPGWVQFLTQFPYCAPTPLPDPVSERTPELTSWASSIYRQLNQEMLPLPPAAPMSIEVFSPPKELTAPDEAPVVHRPIEV